MGGWGGEGERGTVVCHSAAVGKRDTKKKNVQKRRTRRDGEFKACEGAERVERQLAPAVGDAGDDAEGKCARTGPLLIALARRTQQSRRQNSYLLK